MQVILGQPRGFCAGVDRAIEIVKRAIDIHGAPVYVRHEIVHNTAVVSELRERGAVFIEHLSEVPAGATLVFSAHGVPRAVVEEARTRGFRVFDATCPLVTKVHTEVARMRAQGREILMIGHRGHPEVEGTMGQVDGGIHLIESVADVAQVAVADPDKLAYVTQTTLSLDDAQAIIEAILQRFPNVTEPKKSDICYATQNRQDAVKRLSKQVDVVVVVGSRTSSNSNRLREVAERMGVPAFLVDDPADVQASWLAGSQRVGLTAGASAPESVVEAVCARLRVLGASDIQTMDGVTETIVFPLPKGLAPVSATSGTAAS
jgi:4-hydroxy-3-methylbut-2-enyl diphosphate reductase